MAENCTDSRMKVWVTWKIWEWIIGSKIGKKLLGRDWVIVSIKWCYWAVLRTPDGEDDSMIISLWKEIKVLVGIYYVSPVLCASMQMFDTHFCIWTFISDWSYYWVYIICHLWVSSRTFQWYSNTFLSHWNYIFCVWKQTWQFSIVNMVDIVIVVVFISDIVIVVMKNMSAGLPSQIYNHKVRQK